MVRSSLLLSGLTLSLVLLPWGPAASQASDPTVVRLEQDIAAATDERGAPTEEQFGLRVELARHLLDRDREADAVAQLRIAAELGPLEEDLALLLAEHEIRDGRTAAAGRQYRSISERFGSSLAEIRLAGLAADNGRDKQALAHAERAVALARKSSDPRELQRALHVHWKVAERMEAFGVALSTLEELANLAPDDSQFPWYIGQILALQGKNAEAVEALLQAHELAGDGFTALNRDLALALLAEDRFEEARPHLEAYLRDRPLDLDAQAAMAQLEERLGESDAAEARARRVLESQPDHPVALLVLGRTLAASGDLEAARRALASALEGDPASAKTHYQLSLVCARAGDRECAERHLARYQQLQDAPEDVVEMTKQ